MPRTHWLAGDYFSPTPGTPDKVYTTRGGFLPEVDFSPAEFGLPPSTVSATDTAQLLALVVAKRVLAEATGGRYETMDRSRVSVLLGVASATELVAHMSGRLQIPVVSAAMRAAGVPEADAARVRAALEECYVPWQEGTFPGMLGNVVAGRIANRFDLGGTNAVLDAACAGSLAAVDMAIHELSSNRADLVITGGVDTLNDILMFMCFAQTGALSRSGDCRPFSKDADGTMLGEGIGLFALRRLVDAERDGDAIYAVIRAVGSSSDGRATSIYAPLAAGQVRALERAYARAAVSPATIGLIEAHGTGTIAGDATEVEALCGVYDAAGARPKQTAIGSVKSQIGHTKAAAGAAGLAKATLALHHKVLPPTLKVTDPLPALAEDTCPFYVSTELRPWVHGASHPRRAAVSALGFGGTNFHLVLEAYEGPAPRPPRLRALPSELVVLGAPDARALAGQCREQADVCLGPGALSHLAKRTQLAYDPASKARVALVADGEAQVAAQLRCAADALDAGHTAASPLLRGVFFGEGPSAGPIAFLFPGQGSQSVGMGGDLAAHFEEVREIWDEAARLDLFSDEGLHDRVFPPPALTEAAKNEQELRLTATEWAQPALACAGLAMWRLLHRMGVSPVFVAGHSLGELTALAAGGALDPIDAIRVARTRGELMAEASRTTEGAMTAVPATRDHIEALLAEWQSPVTLANHNAPLQVVLSGDKTAIADAERRLAEKGLSAQRLSVATAFHSPVVSAACAAFRRALATFDVAPFQVPVVSNVTAAPYPADADAVRDQLAAAVASPVRFVEQIEAMFAGGARTFIEVGPGQVLTALVGRCLEARPHLAVALDQPGKHGVTALFHALGRLAAAGVPLDFAPLWEGQALPDDPANPAPSKLVLRLNGANFGKPYPNAAEEAFARALAKAPPPIAAPAGAPAEPPAEMEMPPAELAASSSRQPTQPWTPAPQTTPAGASWIAAVRELHAPIIAAQLDYERTMAESHTAFLRAIEASYATLSQTFGASAHDSSARSLAEPPPVATASVAQVPQLPVAAPPAVMSAPPSRGAAALSSAAGGPTRAVKAAPQAPIAPQDLLSLMLAVVSEKTGYPIEMIETTMDLQSDLGIDSIKRVEILAATRARVPGLPEVKPATLAKLRTLAEIARLFGGGGDSPTDATSVAPLPAATRVAAPAAPLPATQESSSAAPEASAEVTRFILEASPSAAMGLATPGLFGAGLVAIVPDGDMARLLARRLHDQGIRARVQDRVPEDARAVVFLGGLRDIANSQDAIRVNREAFEVARTFARRARDGGCTFISVQDTGGDLGLSGASGDRAWLGGLAALAKTAAEEWSESCARAIDVERGDRDEGRIADALVRELLTGGSEREVGLASDGSRVALREVPAPLTVADGGMVEDGVVLVSGGGRGVTAECVLALAAVGRPRLVLIGRTVLDSEPAHFRGALGEAELKRAALEAARRSGGTPGTPREIAREVEHVLAAREVRATLARLSELGVDARYEGLDVRDTEALEALLHDVRKQWGPIKGLLHGAGVLADALLEDRADASQFERVFDTKVLGLAALLRATRADPLSWICLFSSAAARAGNAGQADYAMANEVLNKVAAAEARRRGDSVRVVSIGWGPWAGGMVTPLLQEHFASRGVGLIPFDRGARAFVREISCGEAPKRPVEVLVGSPRLTAAQAPRRGEVWIDEASMPYLGDHRIHGTVVLPVALAIEWFARLAAPRANGPLSLRDVRVLRGILLPEFGRAGQRLQLAATKATPGGTSLELRDAEGAVRLAATFDLTSPAPTHPPSNHAGDADSPPGPKPLYGPDRLFHGPQFQVLSRLHAISPHGGRATVTGTLDIGWAGGPWRADPAALDAALQIALLSGASANMGVTLPLAIAHVVVWRPAERGPITCVVETRARSAERAIFDAWLTGADGAALAELRGIEMFPVPSGAAAG